MGTERGTFHSPQYAPFQLQTRQTPFQCVAGYDTVVKALPSNAIRLFFRANYGGLIEKISVGTEKIVGEFVRVRGMGVLYFLRKGFRFFFGKFLVRVDYAFLVYYVRV